MIEVGTVDGTRLDDAARAAGRQLLGVLEDESNLSGELVAPLAEDLGGGEQHRGVTVVAARVHDPGPRRGVGHVVLLVDRQRVHVGSKHDHLAGARALQPGDDRRARRALDLEPAERAEGVLDEIRGFVLFERELGVRVEVPAPRDRAGFQVVRDECASRLPSLPSRLKLPGTSEGRRG